MTFMDDSWMTGMDYPRLIKVADLSYFYILSSDRQTDRLTCYFYILFMDRQTDRLTLVLVKSLSRLKTRQYGL